MDVVRVLSVDAVRAIILFLFLDCSVGDGVRGEVVILMRLLLILQVSVVWCWHRGGGATFDFPFALMD